MRGDKASIQCIFMSESTMAFPHTATIVTDSLATFFFPLCRVPLAVACMECPLFDRDQHCIKVTEAERLICCLLYHYRLVSLGNV